MENQIITLVNVLSTALLSLKKETWSINDVVLITSFITLNLWMPTTPLFVYVIAEYYDQIYKSRIIIVVKLLYLSLNIGLAAYYLTDSPLTIISLVYTVIIAIWYIIYTFLIMPIHY